MKTIGSAQLESQLLTRIEGVYGTKVTYIPCLRLWWLTTKARGYNHTGVVWVSKVVRYGWGSRLHALQSCTQLLVDMGALQAGPE